MKKVLHDIPSVILPGILNSYSVIFFFNNHLMAAVLMMVTFFNFYAGLSGLLATSMAVSIAYAIHLDHFQLKKGLFSFNALLLGIGMGSFYEPSPFFFLPAGFGHAHIINPYRDFGRLAESVLSSGT